MAQTAATLQSRATTHCTRRLSVFLEGAVHANRKVGLRQRIDYLLHAVFRLDNLGPVSPRQKFPRFGMFILRCRLIGSVLQTRSSEDSKYRHKLSLAELINTTVHTYYVFDNTAVLQSRAMM